MLLQEINKCFGRHNQKESKWKVEVQKEKMKLIFNEFKDTKFIWAEPKHDTKNFTFNNLTYETYDNIY